MMSWSDPTLIERLQRRLRQQRGKATIRVTARAQRLGMESAKAKARCIELDTSIRAASAEIDALRRRLVQIELADAMREARARVECIDLLAHMVGPVVYFDGVDMTVEDEAGDVTDIRTRVANLKLMHPEMFSGTGRRMSMN